MSDPIDDRLSSFDPGVPMPPLPPSDVRRRGDRMRRRNRGLAVAGAALAMAVVATPLALLAQGGEAVAPAAPPAPLAAEIDVLAPDEAPARERLQPWAQAPADDVVLACQPDSLDALGARASVSGQLEADAVLPPGTTADPTAPDVPLGRIRETVLQFADPSTADTAYDTVAGWIDTCPGDPEGADGDRRDVRDLPVTGGRAQWQQRSFSAPDVCADDCDAVRFDQMGVARVEDRLVLLSFAEVGGPLEPELLDASMDTLFTAAIEKARADVDDVPAQPTTPEGPSTEIPEEFPLDQGLVELTAAGGELTGPAPDGPAVFFAEGWCGVDVWPAGRLEPVERLGVSISGADFYEARELATFATSDEARSVVAMLSSAVLDCPTVPGQASGGDTAFKLLPDDTGALDSTTFSSFRAGGSNGSSVYQFTAIGNAVLASVVTGDMSESSADTTARALSQRNRPVLDEVCAFTGAC